MTSYFFNTKYFLPFFFFKKSNVKVYFVFLVSIYGFSIFFLKGLVRLSDGKLVPAFLPPFLPCSLNNLHQRFLPWSFYLNFYFKKICNHVTLLSCECWAYYHSARNKFSLLNEEAFINLCNNNKIRLRTILCGKLKDSAVARILSQLKRNLYHRPKMSVRVRFWDVSFILLTASYEQEALDRHNYFRRAHTAPMMTLNGDMSRSAQAYAERLARMGSLQHSGSSERPGQGENLAMTCGRSFTGATAVDMWLVTFFISTEKGVWNSNREKGRG